MRIVFETLFRIKYTRGFSIFIKAVILSPHIAGWTFESHERLAQVIVDKIAKYFGQVKVEAIEKRVTGIGFFLNQKSQNWWLGMENI
jgi:D-3-phosphoglycerate dehydrogenase